MCGWRSGRVLDQATLEETVRVALEERFPRVILLKLYKASEFSSSFGGSINASQVTEINMNPTGTPAVIGQGVWGGVCAPTYTYHPASQHLPNEYRERRQKRPMTTQSDRKQHLFQCLQKIKDLPTASSNSWFACRHYIHVRYYQKVWFCWWRYGQGNLWFQSSPRQDGNPLLWIGLITRIWLRSSLLLWGGRGGWVYSCIQWLDFFFKVCYCFTCYLYMYAHKGSQ